MQIPSIDQPLSRLTANIIVFLLNAASHRRGSKVSYGLPAGAVHLKDINLIVAATPCAPPLFEPAAKAAVTATGANLILAHHGLHPESLNEVVFSVVIHVDQEPRLLREMVLFKCSRGQYWLINCSRGEFIAIDPLGLCRSHKAPYRSIDEKSAGLCAAAADIMRAARWPEVAA